MPVSEPCYEPMFGQRRRNFSATRMVGQAVYLCFMDRADIDPEERIGEIGVAHASRVGEVEVDDEHGNERKQNVEAQFAKSDIGVPWKDLAVLVAVPEQDVLLENGLAS